MPVNQIIGGHISAVQGVPEWFIGSHTANPLKRFAIYYHAQIVDYTQFIDYNDGRTGNYRIWRDAGFAGGRVTWGAREGAEVKD